MTPATRYQGRPCRKCSGTERLAANRHCVACHYGNRGTNRGESPAKVLARVTAWQVANPDRFKAIKAAYVQRNYETHKAGQHRRRAVLAKAPGSFTAADVEGLFQEQGGICVYCPTVITRTTMHRDHRQPLNRGGSNFIQNIQLTCGPCNLSKGTKTHAEFLEYLSRRI